MQTEYAMQYEDLWTRHWWWRARERFVAAHLGRLAAISPTANRRILDVGCGNGLFFDTLKTYGSVWGIEPDAGLVTDGPHRARIDVRGFDASYVPPEGKPFDWVLMLDVLEHIKDDTAAAAHVKHILAPGGIFLLTVPALMSLWSQHDDANHHFRRYTKSTLRRTLAAAGFEVQSVGYFFGWAVMPLLLRRMLAPGKKIDASNGTYAVRVPPAPINAAMYGVARTEQLLLSGNGRWSLPLGSSLIAIASKNK